MKKIISTTPSQTEPYILDDTFKISEEVLKMTPEERWALVARLEAEGRREKERIEREIAEHGDPHAWIGGILYEDRKRNAK